MRRRIKQKKKFKSNTIFLLVVLPILLCLIGLYFIFEASSISAFRTYGDSFYFLKNQLRWLFIGLLSMTFFSIFNYKKLYYFSFPILFATVGLLFIVLIPSIGTHISGARRWIDLGFVNVQPTEVAKFAIILYLSSWFLHKEKQRFLSFLFLLFLVISLTMIQPDMGTAIILFCLFVVIYYIAGEPIRNLFLLIPFSAGAFFVLIQTSPYRTQRLMTFLNPSFDPKGIGYHITQILVSLSQGGLIGRGLSASRQKYQFLPEAHTDSIFAIIGEEIGFLGVFILIIALCLLVYVIYNTAQKSKDKFGYLLAGSVCILISLQILVNLGAMVAIIPLTGIPLPFISYGGSSLIIFLSLMGIVINIAKYSKV